MIQWHTRGAGILFQDDLPGPFQPKLFYDSMILWNKRRGTHKIQADSLKCLNYEYLSFSCRLEELCSVRWCLCFCAAMLPYLTDQRKDYKSYVVSNAGVILPAKLICWFCKISQSYFNRPILVLNTWFLNHVQVNTGASKTFRHLYSKFIFTLKWEIIPPIGIYPQTGVFKKCFKSCVS